MVRDVLALSEYCSVLQCMCVPQTREEERRHLLTKAAVKDAEAALQRVRAWFGSGTYIAGRLEKWGCKKKPKRILRLKKNVRSMHSSISKESRWRIYVSEVAGNTCHVSYELRGDR